MQKEIDAILSKWWRDHIANSTLSRSTEIHNALAERFEQLRSDLKAWAEGKDQAAS